MILDKETFESIGKTFEEAKQKSQITCQCDYCGAVFQRLKHNIERSWKNIKKDSCSDVICVQKKRVESNRVVFGTDNAFQNKDVKDKIKQSNIDRYGVANPFQNKQVQEKQRQTCQKKYGVDNAFQSEKVKDKIKETMQAKYGVDNPFQNGDVQKKQKATLTQRHGVSYALQNPQFRKKAMDTCVANFGHFPANNYGKTQKDIQDWLNSFGFDFKSNRSLVVGKEIDLYDDQKKLAIEYCGLHWHHEFSPEPRNNKYHCFKHQECLKQGVQLLTVFSDEWVSRKQHCQSHIKSILGVCSRKLHGRKCLVKEINKVQGREFFQEHHIQGRNNLGIVFFGLFHEDELVGVISLGRHNRQFGNLVLDRLCFKEDVQVRGGASKLFSRCVDWAKKNGTTEILSFSDNRWSVGGVYEAMKFRLDREYRPDYSYVNMKTPNERISKQSQKKKATGCPDGMTEYEWAHARGLARIWDCGKKRWIFDITL